MTESVARQNLTSLGVPYFNSPQSQSQSPAEIQSQFMNMRSGAQPSRGFITSTPNDFFNQANMYDNPVKWAQSQSNWGDQPQSITDQISQLKLTMGLPVTKPLPSTQKLTPEQFAEMQKQALTQQLPQQQQQPQQPKSFLDNLKFLGGKSYRRKARKAAKKSRKARKAAKKSKRSSRR